MQTFPEKIRFSQRGVKTFFSEIDKYLADRLAGRQSFLAGLTYLNHNIFRDYMDFDKIFFGKDSWLFLGNNYENILNKLQGWVSDEQIKKTEKWTSESIIKKLERYRDIPVIVTIGPNKSTIYPEYLPKVIKPSKLRFIEPFLRQIEHAGITVYDPTEDLIKTKQKALLYYRTDTHWNNYGASIAGERLIQRISNLLKNPDIRLPEYNLIPSSPFEGDLVGIGGFKNIKLKDGDNYTLSWKEPRSNLFLLNKQKQEQLIASNDALALSTGQALIVRNPDAVSPLKAWLLRDSFAFALSPHIHAVFSETRHWHVIDFMNGKLNFDNIPLPDIIILEIVERSF